MTTEKKVELTLVGLGGIAQLVGQSSGFGKAVAVAQAIQDTYAGANKAIAQGGIFGGIAAAGIIAAGLANVKKITSTKTPQPPALLGASTGGGVATPSPQAPSFNIVGSDPQTQLADAIGQQTQKPVKAFVVAGDVSTAQSLDRNIIQESSLG